MRSIVVGAFALAVAAASPAWADHHHGGGGGEGAHHAGSGGGGGGGGGGMGDRHRSHDSVTIRDRGHGVAVREHFGRHGTSVTVHDRRGFAAHRWGTFRRAYRAPHRFRIGVYRRPAGWYSHHWYVGAYLPRGWFVRDYWIGDWGMYGLIDPPDGLVWVRVGPDAMLIDPDTGEVVRVVYGIFW